MEQTAIEWLLEVLNDQQLLKNYPIELLEQAKEMEKEKIENAYQQGYNNAYFNNPISKDQYYNETFEKK